MLHVTMSNMLLPVMFSIYYLQERIAGGLVEEWGSMTLLEYFSIYRSLTSLCPTCVSQVKGLLAMSTYGLMSCDLSNAGSHIFSMHSSPQFQLPMVNQNLEVNGNFQKFTSFQ